MKKIYIITGGTMVHIAPHLSICAPAYGTIGAKIANNIQDILRDKEILDDYFISVLPTSMAVGNVQTIRQSEYYETVYNKAGIKKLETNEDLSNLVDYLIEQPDTRCIIMAAAVCDFKPSSLNIVDGKHIYPSVHDFGKDQERLVSRDNVEIHLTADNKIVSKIRKTRKDIFLVSFKTTAGVGRDETYRRGLESLKKNSSNLVFANDIQDKINMVITPEEYPYEEQTREETISTLSEMIVGRIQLTFNRTSVVPGDKANLEDLFESGSIPENFLTVMGSLVLNNAFKPFRGKTSGHFGCKVKGREFDRISSIRKVDHNMVFEEGMAKIFIKEGEIIAIGGKPSVGEHTQQMIYDELGDKAHSIVHFHSPIRQGIEYIPFKIKSQKPFECGSNECGTNTASGMENVGIDGIFAVHLENHGPNIAFHKDVNPQKVIDFIDLYWDLSDKEGGLIKEIKVKESL